MLILDGLVQVTDIILKVLISFKMVLMKDGNMKKKIVNLCTRVSLDEILESIIHSGFDTKTLVNFASNLGEGGDIEFDIELLKKTIGVIISCEDKDDEHLTRLIEKLKEVKMIL